MLEKELAELTAAIAREGFKTALVEARTAVIASMNANDARFKDFVLSLDKSKNLMSHLSPEKEEEKDLTIIIEIPDFGAIEVVGTNPRPDETAEEAEATGEPLDQMTAATESDRGLTDGPDSAPDSTDVQPDAGAPPPVNRADSTAAPAS